MPDSLDDIFNDDALGLLNPKEAEAGPKSDEDRLIDSFEEINAFYEKAGREPGSGSMSEYNLSARLKGFRGDDGKKRILKPFDRFNLLGHVEMELQSLDDVLGDDELGLLHTDADNSIFQFKHTPRNDSRAATDFVALRKPMKEEEFVPYEKMFRQVHKELKEGKRRLLDFVSIEKNLKAGNFYLLDGLLLFLESANTKEKLRGKSTGGRVQKDGRTNTIFENCTRSNMLFRSLGKAIQDKGMIVTAREEWDFDTNTQTLPTVSEDSQESGWVYVLSSKSTHPQITSIPNLYKIGFSKGTVEERIRNATDEPTYLFADVTVVATYHCYDLNIQQLENLLHRFFAEACLNIDVFDGNGQRHTPREWFCVPLEQINQAINLMKSGEIVNYRFDALSNQIVGK